MGEGSGSSGLATVAAHAADFKQYEARRFVGTRRRFQNPAILNEHLLALDQAAVVHREMNFSDPLPPVSFTGKSTVEEIRARFDADVERFSNLNTGQAATMDAPLVLELISDTVKLLGSEATGLLDIGCGAGNWTLKLMPCLPKLQHVTLVDLSLPMLERAVARITDRNACDIPSDAPRPTVDTIQGDVREIEPGTERFDIVVAAAVLHHLRADAEWTHVFKKIYTALRKGGAFFVSDLLDASIPAVREVMQARYAKYLESVGGVQMRDFAFSYIEKEDSQRPIVWQLDRLREAGFREFDVIHKNGPFGAYVAIK